ncbi:major facilitator superfamily domain-containing protein [Gongronella butleri]|nr:major facilitator superfamily domain-containing protein [Gongronella butleri]
METADSSDLSHPPLDGSEEKLHPGAMVSYHDHAHEVSDGNGEHTSRTAWIVLLVTISVNSSCALMWMTGSSIPTAGSIYFGVDLTALNWLSNAAAILNSLMSIPAAWCYERLGLKMSLILAAGLNAIGCWLRCLSIVVPEHSRFAMMMFGQIVAGVGGPIVYNIATKLAAVWFCTKDRPIANMLISIQLGMVLAPLVLPRIVSTPEDVPRMLLIVAGVATASGLPAIFIPAKPVQPPTKSAMEQRMSIRQGLRELVKHHQFWWLTLVGSVVQGMGYSSAVLIMQVIIPLGYTDDQAGLCSSVIVIAGFAGGLMFGYWAGKTAQHLMLIKLFTPMVLFSYVTFPFLLIPNAYGAIILACFMNGFTSYGIFPVMLEYASEMMYPVPESISSCFIWTWVTVFMLVFSVMIDGLRAGPDANPPNNMNNSMIAMIVVTAVGVAPVLWLKGSMKRTAVDKSKSSLSV